MDKVIDVDFRVIWQAPVFIRTGTCVRERIDGPDAALQALANRWPASGTEFYAEAQVKCLHALARHGSVEAARSRFVNAAVAAGIIA
ncbi:DUF982 domain-containing protein [Rhizobium hidalgonense]|uniref:DUF982 domain-containing protein n=1 Tax=Rhizobium hidalgonense TaxID=1538159 RepID=A0A2A6K7T7_9HYPH|nr:DUF982 domain-containing protein [Rhizobium hidalgonense]MDR9776005.1 DUF982 domain-containing protein [Rhizobium hidalgonense]MDR9814104.1 DUF982 domain-containing protein [Rhizobium hidalgonense]MDR9820812.1 DUF982 domain-containing protein [Rhizobium hidalgonense]PDT20966.1 hypothetical protein CO674_25070 [Rhizobium hidalgonense]PON07198.1 hypothetical protein ATY29_12750 [Rhizobium hidalgonense]